MFTWSILLLIVSLLAGALGFWGLSGTAAWAARLVFIAGLALLIFNVLFGRRR